MAAASPGEVPALAISTPPSRLKPAAMVAAIIVVALVIVATYGFGRHAADGDAVRLAQENATLRQDLQSLQARTATREQQYRAGMQTLAAQSSGAEAAAPVEHAGLSWTTKLGILALIGAAIMAVTTLMPGGVAVAGMFGGSVAVVGGLVFVVVAVCLLI